MSDDKDGAWMEAEAALVLGRLEGALTHAPACATRIFATRIIRDVLVTALRQDGHAFTDSRFDAWFAGLATLTDERPRSAHPPRALCEGILTELAHAGWAPMAMASKNWQLACLAPRDPHVQGAHRDTHHVIASARTLLDETSVSPSPLPFPALASLYAALNSSRLFAPLERNLETLAIDGTHRAIESATQPSPVWAIEMLAGDFLRRCGSVQTSLPWPGLIRSAQCHSADLEGHSTWRASAFRTAAGHHYDRLERAVRLSALINENSPARRSNSRAPALLELLAGFGAMRSRQIENILGASRLGVRGMLSSLDATGLLANTKIQGVRLYSIAPDHRRASDAGVIRPETVLSKAALDDFDQSMEDIDRLLARYEDTPFSDEE